MPSTPDILIYSPDHELEAVVEIKNFRDADEDWAVGFRRNLQEHRLLPRSHFFLLISPDTVWLWSSPDQERPVASTATREALGPFAEALPEPSVSASSLELVVSSWLRALTSSALSEEEMNHMRSWLVDTGLYDRIRGGRVEYAPAA